MKSVKLKFQIIKIALSTIVVLIVLVLSYSRVFDVYELPLLDLRYKMRPTLPIYNKIAFIEIADDSIKKIGSWPFDRKYHALLVKALSSAGVKQIIFDMFFSEKKIGDEGFAEVIKEAGNVYMPYVFSGIVGHELDLPLSEEYDALLIDAFDAVCKGTGHINIIPDIDGTYRRIPPFIKYHGRLYPHITFLAAVNYMGLSIDSVEVVPTKYVKIKDDIFVPLDLHSNIIVNFIGKWTETFRHYSYIDILTSYIASLEGNKGVVDLKELKDAICFVGVTATAGPDIHPSPYEYLYPGVGVHASLFNSIIYKKFVSRTSRPVNMLILILLCSVTYFCAMRRRKSQSVFYLVGSVTTFFIFATVLFIITGIWIDVFYPVLMVTLVYLGLTFFKYVTEMQKREVLEKELSIAKDIQQSFLPTVKPKVAGIDLEAKMLTARQVGGDLYDFFDISDKKVGVMIGDVSGKGVPAALYMAKVVGEFKSYAREESLSNALSMLNNRLIAESTSSLFVTLAYIVFDMEKMVSRFSLGGHMPTLMLRPDEKEPRMLDLKVGMPLGMMEGAFEEGSVDIKKGDLFVLYTDGVTEAMNMKNEMFEEEGLIRVVKQHRTDNVGALVEAIHKAVTKYAGKAPQHDDITVIAIKIV